MTFEPGDKAYSAVDGHEVEVVSGPHSVYQVRQPDGTTAARKADDLSVAPPDPRREAIREGLRAFTGTYTLCTGGGREYPVNQEDLVACILAALDEGSSRGVRWYRDVEGDLWEWTHADWYRWVENAAGCPVPGTECLTLSRANLEHEYGPLTAVMQ